MISHGLRVIVSLVGIVVSMISLQSYAQAQTIPIPEFKPNAPEVQQDGSSQLEPEAESEPPRPIDYAMKVQLEPNEDEFAFNPYRVSNFAIATSNSSELCPTGNFEFDLDGGEVTSEITPGERQLTGKLRVDTGDSTKIMNLFASWQIVEEREQDGEQVVVIEGTLDAGNDPMNPDYQSQINGTLTPDDEDLILEAHGTAGRPV